METIYTGACSAALNGNAGVPAVSFRMPCVSSQLVLLFLFFFSPLLSFFPSLPPSLSFQGTTGISYTSARKEALPSVAKLGSLPLPCPLRCELHEISVFFFVLEFPCRAYSALCLLSPVSRSCLLGEQVVLNAKTRERERSARRAQHTNPPCLAAPRPAAEPPEISPSETPRERISLRSEPPSSEGRGETLSVLQPAEQSLLCGAFP